MNAGPLFKLSDTIFVRAGHVAAVRFCKPITNPAGEATTRAELEVELSTGSIYRIHGDDADRMWADIQAGHSGL